MPSRTRPRSACAIFRWDRPASKRPLDKDPVYSKPAARFAGLDTCGREGVGCVFGAACCTTLDDPLKPAANSTRGDGVSDKTMHKRKSATKGSCRWLAATRKNSKG